MVPVLCEMLDIYEHEAQVVPRLDLEDDVLDDITTVVGVFPINVVAELNRRGIRFLAVVMDNSLLLKGEELDEETVRALEPELQEFVVFSRKEFGTLLCDIAGMYQHEADYPKKYPYY